MAEAAGIEPMLTGAGTVPKRYRGVPVPSWFHDATSQKLEGMALRDTDVVLASWPKAGTHWLFKALRLLSGASEGDMTLVEMLPPAAYDPSSGAPPPEKSRWNPTGEDHFDALLEREAAGDFRILVTHAPADWLPFKAGQTGGGKLVYVTRNPRDVVVSNYFFLGTPKDGWDGSMNRFLASAERTPNAFGGWFEHVAEFEALVDRLGPERAVIIEYEEMHQDLQGQLRRLATLLGPSVEARLDANMDAICAALGFTAMKEAGGNDAVFLRQGKAGGWRDHFSETDTERMAQAIEARLPGARSKVGHSSWRAQS
eukprot:Tamp_19322.p1 GENE.Tamp_19322~~Tamp_19322.p1  ORF type:complete len:341 (-),score=75.24 Tamp_19322:245-1183(-)